MRVKPPDVGSNPATHAKFCKCQQEKVTLQYSFFEGLCSVKQRGAQNPSKNIDTLDKYPK